ncbi:MAG: lysophospholipid acyltransferase family protein [Dehalococcoidia bacterium]|nr:lysophospholipid acyltransferase family protein [Dehalococcoidia bacterium]
MLLACVRLLGRLPTRVLYLLAEVAALLFYLFAWRLRRNVWDNMRHVMGPNTPKKKLRRATRQVFGNWAKSYADVIHLPYLNLHTFLGRKLIYHGFEENLLPAITNGKGVILTSGHFGSVELAIQGLVAKGVTATVLTEPLQPPALSHLLDGLRASKGHTFLPVSIGSIKTILRSIKAGGMVGLMCDRDIEGRSIRVPFCGTPASVPVGVVELAMRTGVPLIPIFVHRRNGDACEAFVEPPLELVNNSDPQADLKTNVRRLLERFEAHLRSDPGQWTVLEKVWDAEEDREP